MLNRQEYQEYQEYQDPYGKKKTYPIDQNERMTAMAGALLFVFIIVELFITASLDGLTTEHIFVGILISGPLVVKMFSTGYRFFRYYTKSPEFVKSGPPNIILRLLAPFLLLTTILVFISGYGLAFGHADKLFGKIHATCVPLWIALVAVHAYAYIRKVPALIAKDWSGHTNRLVPGRIKRLGINLVGLIVGAIAAIGLLPLYSQGWGHLKFNLPGPLSLGFLLAIIGILVAIPLLRLTKRMQNREN